MIVCSFHTTPEYADHAERLADSLDRWKIDYLIRGVPDQGSYARNLFHKAAFIREIRKERPGETVVWIDADALLVQRPFLLETLSSGQSLAAVFWRPRPCDPATLLGGTLAFGPGLEADRLLDRWEEENARHPAAVDQENLARALERSPKAKAAVIDLPAPYCWIERPMRPFLLDESPVIFHLAVGRDRWAPRSRR